jgi:AraC-like DNA-binding protein
MKDERGGEACDVESRTRLLDLSVGLVENLQRAPHATTPEDFCPVFQVCLPYRGLGIWHVGRDDVVADANQVLFVRGGESYRLTGPVPGGYAELIITPDLEVLSDVAHVNGCSLTEHPLFTRRTSLAEPRLQAFRTRFLHWAESAPDGDPLEAEELALALLRSTLRQRRVQHQVNSATTARLIRRTKEFLEAMLSNRIRLADIAVAVGASSAYLTDLFSRVEGVPLHLMQLRLARALVELPHAHDLTTLALELGFSSHSHFTFVFRRAFGCTPSEFRESSRSASRPSFLHTHTGRAAG